MDLEVGQSDFEAYQHVFNLADSAEGMRMRVWLRDTLKERMETAGGAW